MTSQQLRLRASAYRGVVSAAMFVESEVSPVGQKTDRRFTDGYIPYTRLLSYAKEWDEDGLTTLSDFLDAMECEMAGAARSNVVAETMILVGAEAARMASIEADW